MKNNLIKKLISAVLGFVLIIGISGCGSTSVGKSGDSEYGGDVNQIIKQYPEGTTMKLSYAKNFKIEYLANGNKLVTDGAGKQVVLLQKGQSLPTKYASLPSIQIPISDVIYTSTTTVSYLRALTDEDVFNSIIGVRARVDDWDFDAMKTRMQNGTIVDIGSNTSMTVSYDYEIIQALEPTLVITTSGMSTAQTDLMGMLDQEKIPYVFDASSSEKDYRGTMEWMKFVAAFYNLEADAENYFSEGMSNIDKIIEKTSKISEDKKVKIGWGIVAGGMVYVENGGSKSAQMVRDCGGKYIFDDIGAGKDGVTSITAEEFYARLSEADLFINRSMPKYSSSDVSSITDQLPALKDVKCLMTPGCVLQITDNFWSSYHNIDAKYVELAEFMYPDQFNTLTSDQFTHFQIMTVGK